jgi:glycosyltransferase involved in cell wall biosynthesis
VAELVSTIMPVFNGEAYIAEAIGSVIAQSYPHWELIVVDDGSTDGSARVVERFHDPRIRTVHQPNQGLAGARNTGIRVAQGAYLAFLDADDTWDSEFLSRCMATISRISAPEIAGVYTTYYHIDQQGRRLPQLGSRPVAPERFHEKLLRGGFFPPLVALVRADVVRQLGLFDPSLRAAEDWDLWLRLSRRYSLHPINEPLANYRLHATSLSYDVKIMRANAARVMTKHFGSDEGDRERWSIEKRKAYGSAYRQRALSTIQAGQPETGLALLTEAISIWPRLLEELNTFYELACGNQPRGYRGQAALLDLNRAASDILAWLDRLYGEAGPAISPFRRVAYSQAYLALGMLSDEAGRWGDARRYFLLAFKENPRLARSFILVRRLLKVCTSPRLVRLVRLAVRSAARVRWPSAGPRRQAGARAAGDQRGPNQRRGRSAPGDGALRGE